MWPAKAKAWLGIEPSVADPERVQLRQNYFIFMENFQKNLRKLINNQVELTNRTPLYKFEPPIKKSWIPPPLAFDISTHLLSPVRQLLLDSLSVWVIINWYFKHCCPDETPYYQASQLGLHCLLYVTFEKPVNRCIGAVSSELIIYGVPMFKG